MQTNRPTASETSLAPVHHRLPLAALPEGRKPAKWPGEPSVSAGVGHLPQMVGSTQYVTIQLAAVLTGYSPKAIRRKIESGIWLEGREYRKAPDGHVLISMKGYQLWVERGRV